MNFFTALIETCKGTSVFINLLSQSIVRTLWHLLVLIFFCSLFITLCNYPRISSEVADAFTLMEKTFGDIQTGKNGITPEKVHEKTSLTINDKLLRISYLPLPDKEFLAEIDANDINFGVLWTPTLIASWFKLGPDKFLLVPVAYCSNQQLIPEIINRSVIPAYIKNNTSLNDKVVSLYSALSWPALAEYSKNTFISSVFLMSIISIAVQVLFFCFSVCAYSKPVKR